MAVWGYIYIYILNYIYIYIYSFEDTDISREGQIKEWNEERWLHSKIVVNEGGAEKVKPGHLVL